MLQRCFDKTEIAKRVFEDSEICITSSLTLCHRYWKLIKICDIKGPICFWVAKYMDISLPFIKMILSNLYYFIYGYSFHLLSWKVQFIFYSKEDKEMHFVLSKIVKT